MKKLILIVFGVLTINAVNAQINNNSDVPANNQPGVPSNGIPGGIQQPGTTNPQSPDFSTAPYIQTAPIPAPVTPNVQTTIPGAETQPGDNTQYPSGSNNSSNANSSGALLNSSMPVPPNRD